MTFVALALWAMLATSLVQRRSRWLQGLGCVVYLVGVYALYVTLSH